MLADDEMRSTICVLISFVAEVLSTNWPPMPGRSVSSMTESIAAQFPDRSERPGRFAFAGMGHSGRGDLSERHKQIRDEPIIEQRNPSE